MLALPTRHAARPPPRTLECKTPPVSLPMGTRRTWAPDKGAGRWVSPLCAEPSSFLLTAVLLMDAVLTPTLQVEREALVGPGSPGAWLCGVCPCGPWLPLEPPPTAQSSWTQLATEATLPGPMGNNRSGPWSWPLGSPSEALAAPGPQRPRQHQSSRWPLGPGRQVSPRLSRTCRSVEFLAGVGLLVATRTRSCPAAAAAFAGGPRPVRAGQGERPPRSQ